MVKKKKVKKISLKKKLKRAKELLLISKEKTKELKPKKSPEKLEQKELKSKEPKVIKRIAVAVTEEKGATPEIKQTPQFARGQETRPETEWNIPAFLRRKPNHLSEEPK